MPLASLASEPRQPACKTREANHVYCRTGENVRGTQIGRHGHQAAPSVGYRRSSGKFIDRDVLADESRQDALVPQTLREKVAIGAPGPPISRKCEQC